MIGKDYFQQRKKPIIIAILFLVIGSIFYFTSGASSTSAMGEDKNVIDVSLFKDIKLKAAYNPEGAVKIFAYVKNNILEKYHSSNGNNIPEYNSMVIGADEARMMIAEKLFQKPEDKLNDLFGIDTTVEGILDSTKTFADDFHFLSKEQFDQLNGNADALQIKFKDENTPKLFYIYDVNDVSPLKLELSEGNLNQFYKHKVGNKTYYPIIIGSKEAKMMMDEKLFTKSKVVINDFFGKDVVIIGIAKETNSALDMMHIVEKDFFD